MAFNVAEFRSQMTGDGARPNLFSVSLTFPSNIANGGIAGQKVTFMAKSAQLPGSTVGTVPLYYFGRELKFAVDVSARNGGFNGEQAAVASASMNVQSWRACHRPLCTAGFSKLANVLGVVGSKRFGQQQVQWLPHYLLGWVAKHFFSGRIEQGDVLILIHGHDGVHDTVDVLYPVWPHVCITTNAWSNNETRCTS